MKSLDYRTTKSVRRRRHGGAATVLALLTLAAIAAAGCGGPGNSPAAGGASSTSIQVLATAKRAATTLKEDMEFMGPVRIKDVEEAQQKIVSIIRHLEETGEIIISRGEGDELVQ